MKKRASHSTSEHSAKRPAPAPRAALATDEIPRCLRAWIQEGVYRQQSPRTNGTRQSILGKLLWFLQNHDLPSCGDAELRDFTTYLAIGHEEKGGRWGMSATRRDLAPSLHRAPTAGTLLTYHAYLRAFFSWCVEQGMLDVSPMAKIKPPPVPKKQPDPFTPSQMDAFMAATKNSMHPKRDAAIIWLLFDTGIRASELCSITLGDLDLLEKRVTVRGKGKKVRSVPFGLKVSQALWSYLREGRRDPGSLAGEAPGTTYGLMNAPLFMPHRGRGAGSGEGLTAGGLYQLIRRLADAAGIDRKRKGPHTLRNTFAVTFLADGGSEKACQEMLGHESLAMTHHYAKFAGTHMSAEHRRHSPVDKHIKRGK